MNERVLLAVGFVAMLGGGGAIAAVSRASQERAHHIIHAEAPPAAASPQATPAMLGVIAPRQAVDVSARAAGRIVRIVARLGDSVRAGDVLAEIDTRELEAEVAAARIAVELAKSQERQRALVAEVRGRKYKRYLGGGLDVLTTNDVESAQYEALDADAQLEEAKRTVSEREQHFADARRRLGDARLVAPFDGAVVALYADVGALAGVGQRVLRIASVGAPVMRIGVSPSVAGRLVAGTRLSAKLDDGRAIPCVVERIAADVDPSSDVVVVEAAIPSGLPSGVRPGEVVRVTEVEP